MTDTKTPAKDTPDEAANNTGGKNEGTDTDPAKNQVAKEFTQADVDRIAQKTRDEEKAKFKAAKEKEDKERAEKDDETQKKFEKLATDRKARIDELEPQLEKLNKVVADLAASELKSLPGEVKDAAPAQYEGDVLTNPLEVLTWLPKGKALAEKLEGQGAKPGAGKDPKAVAGTPQQAYEHSRKQLLNTGKYGM